MRVYFYILPTLFPYSTVFDCCSPDVTHVIYGIYTEPILPRPSITPFFTLPLILYLYFRHLMFIGD